ncbi:MAG: stress response translation initiation inhibitor YciH [Gammaproteobacteria bacterium]|nr:stress response translation initiation inhibitor YciH [Gammaproteobacteria bacterium]MBQ0838568.1 stress response translation initiation inhibitor YciH [Gammaproteobacteria bacterium]
MKKNTRLVYSTDKGRIKSADTAPEASPAGDGIVRIRRETSGRKGNAVTTISGVPLPESELKTLAKKLKQNCGSGGSVKNSVIEIQGDHRETIHALLTKAGYTVKMAGG